MSDWKRICTLGDVPVLGARVVDSEAHGRIAVFRSSTDEVFAVRDKCPHKAGPLSQGIVHGDTVTCPLHSWKIQLRDGQVVPPDVGCVKHFATRVDQGEVFIAL
ncbi:MAG: nitrite reductase small subunit NirD [Zoogloea sp.]|uniref:nitrite reductase small subunit NirD n=1 Tax=Zoogloea sp. TaxID=49181 RepID=UPI00260BE73B|nr:nitrite reductase small subunit NirD [Zoogloea sp.]MDD3326599.1 nitrite reductase small subunit NirD [Zoogloea sp.]